MTDFERALINAPPAPRPSDSAPDEGLKSRSPRIAAKSADQPVSDKAVISLSPVEEQRLTRALGFASAYFETPVAFFSNGKMEGGRFPALSKASKTRAELESALVRRTLGSNTPHFVLDLAEDPEISRHCGKRFSYRFFAGAPIRKPDGAALGAVCLLDLAPRSKVRPGAETFLAEIAAMIADDIAGGRRSEEEATAIARAERRAIQADAAKQRFLAIMNHEMRTPLNALVGFSDILADDALGPNARPTYKEYGGYIRTAAGQLKLLVERVLAYADARTGAATLNETDFAVEPMIRRCASLILADGPQQHVRDLSVRVDAEAPGHIRADETLMTQILVELLQNASTHTPKHSKIDISAGKNDFDGGLAIAVEDDGPGFDPAILKNVAHAFTLGDAELNRRQDGAGLGLAIVQSFVDLHGGRLSVGNRRGGGASIEVALPAARNRDERPAAKS